MKKRTKIIIRIAGVIFIGLSIFMQYKSLQDNILNGIDFVAILMLIIGSYLALGTENSLSSWNINDDNSDD